MKSLLNKGALAALVALLCLFTATTAQATTQGDYDGSCDANELCIYYLDQPGSSRADFQFNVPDFHPKQFLSPGTGQWQTVWHNARSACNWKDSLYAHIHSFENYQGWEDVVPPHQCIVLDHTKDWNGSLIWLSTR